MTDIQNLNEVPVGLEEDVLRPLRNIVFLYEQETWRTESTDITNVALEDLIKKRQFETAKAIWRVMTGRMWQCSEAPPPPALGFGKI